MGNGIFILCGTTKNIDRGFFPQINKRADNLEIVWDPCKAFFHDKVIDCASWK